MTIGQIMKLMQDGVREILMLSMPVLMVALVVGLIVAIFQATTSIQEQTLTFLPKVLAMLVTIGLLGGAMFTHLAEFTKDLWGKIPEFAQ